MAAQRLTISMPLLPPQAVVNKLTKMTSKQNWIGAWLNHSEPSSSLDMTPDQQREQRLKKRKEQEQQKDAETAEEQDWTREMHTIKKR